MSVSYMIADRDDLTNRGAFVYGAVCFGGMKHMTDVYTGDGKYVSLWPKKPVRDPVILYQPWNREHLDLTTDFLPHCPFLNEMVEYVPKITGFGEKKAPHGWWMMRTDQDRRHILWGLQCLRFPIDRGNLDCYSELLKTGWDHLRAMWFSRYWALSSQYDSSDKIVKVYQPSMSQGQHSPVPDKGCSIMHMSAWVKRANDPRLTQSDDFSVHKKLINDMNIVNKVGLGGKDIPDSRAVGDMFFMDLMSMKYGKPQKEIWKQLQSWNGVQQYVQYFTKPEFFELTSRYYQNFGAK